ncbi:hypothetical protein AAFF_G00036850 [Aldrovandia affinis]|uniref:C2H2-type domain-containing protein n=1 Tax=Aldrovandia affinis TaxID=143900 RepID=A0AAD7T5Q7_9TELE|nr:hypothetical protein AAFF_G00036850 [Aldrovandia affinis]
MGSVLMPLVSLLSFFPRTETGQTEALSQVFACSQCPFVHTEEVNLHQHSERVHPEEHSGILSSEGNGARTYSLPAAHISTPHPLRHSPPWHSPTQALQGSTHIPSVESATNRNHY